MKENAEIQEIILTDDNHKRHDDKESTLFPAIKNKKQILTLEH